MVRRFILLLLLSVSGLFLHQTAYTNPSDTIRVAAYNVAMFRQAPGQLKTALEKGGNSRVQHVGAIIQFMRPDVLLLAEFDYDPSGKTLDAFCQHILEVSQKGQDTIHYPYRYQVSTNTGLLSEIDMDGDGEKTLPEDSYGFGRYEGQYAFAFLSKYPLLTEKKRTFQTFKWKDMPDALQVKNPDGSPYYPDSVMQHFRLSSKNHIDLPVRFPGGKKIHLIAAHPTPPTFDGPEDKNGKRNYDEIRLIADYISNKDYLVDDSGDTGGLPKNRSFVILGDLNAAPVDGDAYPGAISQLLKHPQVHEAVACGELVPKSEGGKEFNQKPGDQSDPAYDTSIFGLRLDYVLPSSDLQPVDSGVFWPGKDEPLHHWVSDKAASDHMMVWVDLVL